MNFSSDKPIYIQMSDRLCDDILAGTYQADDRIPSVREYAVMLEVNTTPGMTPTSFIPQQVKAAGLEMKDVLTDIVENQF